MRAVKQSVSQILPHLLYLEVRPASFSEASWGEAGEREMEDGVVLSL